MSWPLSALRALLHTNPGQTGSPKEISFQNPLASRPWLLSHQRPAGGELCDHLPKSRHGIYRAVVTQGNPYFDSQVLPQTIHSDRTGAEGQASLTRPGETEMIPWALRSHC